MSGERPPKGQMWVTPREIVERADGTKEIGYVVSTHDSGLLNCRVRLGGRIIVDQHADGRWKVNGTSLGRAPLSWDLDDDFLPTPPSPEGESER